MIQKSVDLHLKCTCVWCLENCSRILSGKPFNTFCMARLKTLQFRLTLTPVFTATHAFLISLFCYFPYSPFISWSVNGVIADYDWGIFFILVTLDLCLLLIQRDLWYSQKWQILISVNRRYCSYLYFDLHICCWFQFNMSLYKHVSDSSIICVYFKENKFIRVTMQMISLFCVVLWQCLRDDEKDKRAVSISCIIVIQLIIIIIIISFIKTGWHI